MYLFQEYAYPFYKPVGELDLNPQALAYYYTIVKEPMDLTTMKEKIEAGKYKSPGDFVADFQLMLKNCRTFNPAEHVIVSQAKNLEIAFYKELETISKHHEDFKDCLMEEGVLVADSVLPKKRPSSSSSKKANEMGKAKRGRFGHDEQEESSDDDMEKELIAIYNEVRTVEFY